MNPETPINILEDYIDKLDMVILMSVNPGFGGQKFIKSVLSKISKVRSLIDKTNKDIPDEARTECMKTPTPIPTAA